MHVAEFALRVATASRPVSRLISGGTGMTSLDALSCVVGFAVRVAKFALRVATASGPVSHLISGDTGMTDLDALSCVVGFCCAWSQRQACLCLAWSAGTQACLVASAGVKLHAGAGSGFS